jgi:diguanylate cyclase (GGDEF)-like protein/PAS domain S-box-containing protein
MHTPIHPFALFLLLSSAISLASAVIAWRRSAVGSRELGLLLLSMAVWAGFYAVRWLELSLKIKAVGFHLMYLGISVLPTLYLVFVLVFIHQERWLTKRNLLLLCIQPIASILLEWTNGYHHLFFVSIAPIEVDGIVMADMVRGPAYFANMIYSYVMIGFAFLLLSQVALRSSPLYLNQYRLIMIGSILPWVGSLYSELNFSPWHGLDLAPFLFGASGIIFVFALMRTHFMDLIPVARTHLIENMPDGIVVVDAQNRIVDINPAMKNFIEGDPSSILGKDIFTIFPAWMERVNFFDEGETRTELTALNNPSRYLDLRVTPLYDRDHRISGRLLVFRDVTERKQIEKRLRSINDQLQGQLIEIGILQSKLREQAIRDPLTNLFNRRYLEETLDRELSRASRESYPVCIIMIDLDHFKQINDTYGHEAGDLVLKAIALNLSEQSRRGDFACRYGGEEFVVVMPNISLTTAYERAVHLQQLLTSLRVPYELYELHVTLSIGIACYPQHGTTRDVLLRAADQAMYGAKEAGRDHILAYNELNLSEGA